MRQPIIFGLKAGGVLILISLITYLGGIDLFVNNWIVFLQFLIAPVFVFIAIKNQRKSEGGHISFGRAFLTGIVTYAVMRGVFLVYSIALYNVIDPDLKYSVAEAAFDNQIEMMENWGAPESEIDKAYDQYDDLPKRYEVGAQLSFYFILLLLGSFWSLIAALIFKRKPKVE
ncbi:MAG: DUF4199 domain-containing protein [Bacteroidota bacterium]